MERLNKKRYAIVLSILGIASAYIYVFYSHKYNLAFTILPVVFLCVVWMFVLNIWVPSSWTSKMPFLLRQFAYALPLALFYLLLSTLSNDYEEAQLKKYGVVVNGRVIDTHITHSPHQEGSYFYVEIEYNYNKTTYKERLTDSIYTYKYGDELKVLCSSHDPEIFGIVGHKPALDLKY